MVSFSITLIALFLPLCLLYEKLIETIFVASQPPCYLAECIEPLLVTSCEMVSIHVIALIAQFCICLHNLPFSVQTCAHPNELSRVLLTCCFSYCSLQAPWVEINGLSCLKCREHFGACCQLDNTAIPIPHSATVPVLESNSTILGVISLLLTPFSLHSRSLLFLFSFYLYC